MSTIFQFASIALTNRRSFKERVAILRLEWRFPIAKHSPWILVSPLLLSAHSIFPLVAVPSLSERVEIKTNVSLQATATLPSPTHLIASTPGSIRVSNATYHPVRIALLPQVQSNAKIATNLPSAASSQHTDIESHDVGPDVMATTVESTEGVTQYGEPIHWDFVPREGYDSGLVLALAEGHVKVQPGDVLTAFAQDGSRRYWGPYVVGATDSPVWNSETQEWSLVLETPFPW